MNCYGDNARRPVPRSGHPAHSGSRPYPENRAGRSFLTLLGLVALALAAGAMPVSGQAGIPGSREGMERTVHPILRTRVPIDVDAVLDEPIWSQADVIGIPYEWLPGDNTPAPVDTEVRIAYDDDFFYISFVARDPNPREIRAHVRDRDVAFADDHVVFMKSR